MKKLSISIIAIAFLWLLGCTGNVGNSAEPARDPNYFLTATIVPPITPISTPTLEGPLATIIVTFDMNTGGASFDSMIYAQEVYTGKTFSAFMSVGDHHGAPILQRDEPVEVTVQAPGTYVFYSRLTYLPDTYYWGATDCPLLTDCPSSSLIALDVLPNMIYEITISDRDAILPERDKPVAVPWKKKEQ